MTKTQFAKFATAGFIFAIVNVAVLYLFTEYLGIYYILSSIIAFTIGSTGNFLLNKKWTFKETLTEKFLSKYAKAMSVNVSAVIITVALLYILTEYAGFYYLASQAIAMTIAFLANFIGNKKFVF